MIYESKIQPFSSGVCLIPAAAIWEVADIVRYDGKDYEVLDYFEFSASDPHPGGLYLLSLGDRRLDLTGRAVRFYIIKQTL
jgi:hypothetical protein